MSDGQYQNHQTQVGDFSDYLREMADWQQRIEQPTNIVYTTLNTIMENIIEGQLIEIEPEKTAGASAHKIVNLIVKTNGDYPRTICVQVWNQRIQHTQKLQVGDQVRLKVNIESRKYNDNWSTSVSAYDIRQM